MTAAVVTGSVVSDAELLDELRAAWAEVSRGYARCWAAMAEVSSRTSTGWEPAEIAAALTFTHRRAEYELGCALTLVQDLPLVHAALAAGELDHHKARVFTSYLMNVTPEQAERICTRLVPLAPGWTTSQLAARLLREVHAIDPGYTRRTYEQAVRERGVHGYLDHTGTAILTGSGLPAAEAAVAAARLEALADQLRAAGYPATLNQTRADLYLRLLDGTLDGLTAPQIQATMLRLGPLTPADPDPAAQPTGQPDLGQPDHQPPPAATAAPPEHPATPAPPESAEQTEPTEQPGPAEHPVSPVPAKRPVPAEETAPAEEAVPAERPGADPVPGAGTAGPVRFGVEVRVRLSTLLGLDEHPAELAGWGPIPAAAARDLVATQHQAEWRIAIVDTDGYLVQGDLTRRRPGTRADCAGGGCIGGIVEIALPETMLDQLPILATEHPEWARVLAGIIGSWNHRKTARAALDEHPERRFAHAALRRHIQMRDRYCIGIGCRRRAADSELDHTRNHAHGGQTTTANNGPCCARDHLKKHQGDWQLTQPQAGHFIWISPMGQSYHTRGEPLIPGLPAPLPREPDPNPRGLPRMLEGPILHIPEAPPPPPTRPPPTPLPDDPPF